GHTDRLRTLSSDRLGEGVHLRSDGPVVVEGGAAHAGILRHQGCYRYHDRCFSGFIRWPYGSIVGGAVRLHAGRSGVTLTGWPTEQRRRLDERSADGDVRTGARRRP